MNTQTVDPALDHTPEELRGAGMSWFRTPTDKEMASRLFRIDELELQELREGVGEIIQGNRDTVRRAYAANGMDTSRLDFRESPEGIVATHDEQRKWGLIALYERSFDHISEDEAVAAVARAREDCLGLVMADCLLRKHAPHFLDDDR